MSALARDADTASVFLPLPRMVAGPAFAQEGEEPAGDDEDSEAAEDTDESDEDEELELEYHNYNVMPDDAELELAIPAASGAHPTAPPDDGEAAESQGNAQPGEGPESPGNGHAGEGSEPPPAS